MSNEPRNMADIMQMLMASQDGDGSRSRPNTDAVLVALRNALPASLNFNDPEYRHPFTAGEFVRPLKGHSDGYKEPEGGVVMFVRDLREDEKAAVRKQAASDTDLPTDVMLMIYSRDILCLRVLPDGEVLPFPATSSLLEVHPDYRSN